MATSIETVRDALETLLSASLVGVGLPVKTVSNDKVKTLAGATPLVQVIPAGSERDPLTFEGSIPTFRLVIQSWVLQEVTGSWTTAQGMDALNSIEAIIAGVVETNRATAYWSLIKYDGKSIVFEAKDDAGRFYFMERIPLVAHLAQA